METFHLYHLAKAYPRPIPMVASGDKPESPGEQSLPSMHSKSTIQAISDTPFLSTDPTALRHGGIRASAVQMVFASRSTQGFIAPDRVQTLERWVGRACLDALTQFEISEEVCSAWLLMASG